MEEPNGDTIRSAVKAIRNESKIFRGVRVLALATATRVDALVQSRFEDNTFPRVDLEEMLRALKVPADKVEPVLQAMVEWDILHFTGDGMVVFTSSSAVLDVRKALGDTPLGVDEVEFVPSLGYEKGAHSDAEVQGDELQEGPSAEQDGPTMSVEVPAGDPAPGRVASPPLAERTELVEGAIAPASPAAEVDLADAAFLRLHDAAGRVASLDDLERIAEQVGRVEAVLNDRRVELLAAARVAKADQLVSEMGDDPELLTAVVERLQQLIHG